jgi:hypothetical protein
LWLFRPTAQAYHLPILKEEEEEEERKKEMDGMNGFGCSRERSKAAFHGNSKSTTFTSLQLNIYSTTH